MAEEEREIVSCHPLRKQKQASRFEGIGIEKTTTATKEIRIRRTTHTHAGATKKHERRDPRNKKKLGYYNYCSCLSLQQPPLYYTITTTTPSCFSSSSYYCNPHLSLSVS